VAPEPRRLLWHRVVADEAPIILLVHAGQTMRSDDNYVVTVRPANFETVAVGAGTDLNLLRAPAHSVPGKWFGPADLRRA
jgi:hypothetical protein